MRELKKLDYAIPGNAKPIFQNLIRHLQRREDDTVHGWCQSNANQSPNLQMMRISRRQLTPFGQRGGAIFFEGFAAVEMTFEIEMIVDRSMN